MKGGRSEHVLLPEGNRGQTSRMWRLFVSVGTHPQQFDRLLKELDILVGQGKAKADILAQTGNSDYEPKNFKFRKFFEGKEYDEAMQWSDAVVSHGGAGTIINALLQKKPLLVVPRLQEYGEHTNDHQLDLARALEKEKKALAVFDMKELGKKIVLLGNFKPNFASNRAGLEKRLIAFLEEAK